MEFLLSSGAVTLLMAGTGASLLLLVRDLRVLPVHCASIFGVGAYVTAALVRSGLPEILLILPASATCAAAYGAAAAFPVVRRTADRQVIYFVGIQLLFELVLRLTPIAGGASGLSVLNNVTFCGLNLGVSDKAVLAGLSGVIAITIASYLDRLIGPQAALVGAGFDHALGVGIDSSRVILLSHVTTSALLGGLGSCYALHVGFVHPTTVSFGTSVWIIVIGAFAAQRIVEGSIVGSLGVVGTFELLRFVGMPPTLGVQLRQGISGFVLAALVYRGYHRRLRAVEGSDANA